MYYVGQEPDF
jgi:hypothetical protein